jgi:predicted transcriptional regulator
MSSSVESFETFKDLPTAAILSRLRQSGDPVVLTVDGKPEFIVQDADAYRDLVERADQADRTETIAAIREGLKDVEEGRIQPAKEVIRELARKYGHALPGIDS